METDASAWVIHVNSVYNTKAGIMVKPLLFKHMHQLQIVAVDFLTLEWPTDYQYILAETDAFKKVCLGYTN